MADEDELPPGLGLSSVAEEPASASRASGSRSGVARRHVAAQRARAIFLSVGSSPRSLIGAALVDRAETRHGDTTARFVFARFVWLERPQPIERAMVKYLGPVFEFVPAQELRLRRLRALIGGIVNDHFRAFSGTSWRVVQIPAADRLRFDSSQERGPPYMTVPLSTCHQLGMAVTVVQSFTDAEAEAANEDHDHVGPALDAAVGPTMLHAPDAPAAAANADDRDVAVRRLQAMARTQLQGTADHVHTVPAILAMLKFCYNLKPSADVAQALVDAAEIFIGRAAAVRLLEALKQKA